MPTTELSDEDFAEDGTIDLISMLVKAELVPTRSEGRRAIEQGGVSIDGEKITDIARQYHVSRQTIYSQIKRAYNFSDDPDVKMRMNFMNHDDLCTTIDIDFRHEKIKIKNYTDQIIFRAFGVVTDPDWADFEYFLEERCYPRTRDHRKDILREMGLPFYDPLLIIEKTQGRMSDDHQWIMILKKEG